MPPYSDWMHLLALAALWGAVLSAAWIALDELRRPQHMMIMNFVWPLTALYLGPFAVWWYYGSGSKMTHEHHQAMQAEMRRRGIDPKKMKERRKQMPPVPEQAFVGATHCGSGCLLGDIVGEWLVFLLPLTFFAGEFGTRLFVTLLLAWVFGVVFQYFTIVPMRGLPVGKGIVEAMRADTLSILAFQAGMFGWMALNYYVFYPEPHLKPTQAVFWFEMQLAMALGLLTSAPVNHWLLRKGWKEKMPQQSGEQGQRMMDEMPPRAA
ncbi:MAG TPA: DUF4396 domain-containing protein [Terriglobales bacterium]|nr:DUF4396 domain-containing protein [Terriglobales bacterium]